MSAMDEVEAIIRKYVYHPQPGEVSYHGGSIRMWDVEPMIKEVVEFRVHEAMERLGLDKRV